MRTAARDGYSRFVPPGPRVDRRNLGPRVRALMAVNNTRAALEIIWQWTQVAVILIAVTYFNHPLAYIAGMLLIATRQHAMIIVLHDAVHRCLFTNKFANEHLSDLLLGMPVNLLLRGLRAHHLAHHRHVGTDDDPDLEGDELLPNAQGLPWHKRVPIIALYILRRAWMYISVGTVISLLLPNRNPASAYSLAERAGRLAWAAAILAVILWYGVLFEFIVLWIIPYVFILPFFIFIRGRAEHDVEYTEEVRVARFVNAGPLERYFISPNFIQYHTQHHLYPTVPSYNLPKLHKLLMEDETYRQHALMTPSYLSWLREYLTRKVSLRPMRRDASADSDILPQPTEQAH